MARNSIDTHLRQLCRQANSLCKLGEMVTSEEFLIGAVGALLASKGYVNGREKISKKRITESNIGSSAKSRRKNVAYNGNGNGNRDRFANDALADIDHRQNVDGRSKDFDGRRTDFNTYDGECKEID